MKWVVPVSTCPIRGKPYWYTIMHCAFILVSSFFTSIFQHLVFNLFVSVLFMFYGDSLTVEFIQHTQAWLLCHTLMRLILQPLMFFW